MQDRDSKTVAADRRGTHLDRVSDAV